VATTGAALAGLWEQFRGPLSEQVSVIEDAATAMLSGGLDPERRERALREAHKLVGSLGTFGMPRGSDIAREAETWFRSCPSADPAEMLRLADTVMALRNCLDAGPAAAAPSSAPRIVDSGGPFLLLVDEDPDLERGLRPAAAVVASYHSARWC